MIGIGLPSTILIIVLGGFWLGGCSTASSQFNPNAPEITSVSPPDQSAGIDIFTLVTATFDKDMSASTLNTSNFTLTSSEGAVSGSVSYNAASKTASFAPSGNLSYLTRYTAVISDQVKDSEGNRLNSPYSWSFTTGGLSEARGVTDESFSDGNHRGYGIYIEVVNNVEQSSQGESMILDLLGRILVAGKGRDNMTVWRIMPNGSPDESFGGGGTIHSAYEGDDIARSMITYPNGKILVTGDRYSNDISNNGLAIWRFMPDGSADGTFGASGEVIYSPYDRGYSIALDASENIIVTAYSWGFRSPEGSRVLRFKPDGTFDATLPGTPEGVLFRTENTTIDPSGKVLVTGVGSYDWYYHEMVTRRFNSDGTTDESFGTNGIVSFTNPDIGEEFLGKSVLIDAFGRIVVMGGSFSAGGILSSGNERMIVWRYK